MSNGAIINQPYDYVGKGEFPLRVNSSETLLERVPVGIGKMVSLVDDAAVLTDASLGDAFTLTMTASRSFSNPTNPRNCQKIIYLITQGGTGSYTITWDTQFAFSGDLPSPVLSTAVGKLDAIGFLYSSSLTKWLCIAKIGGF